MNRTLQRLISLIVFAVIAVLPALPAAAQTEGRARFVHVTPGVGAVDLYLNGRLLAQDLAHGSASPLFTLPAGDHTLDLTLANQTSSLIQQTITVDAARPTTFFVADGTQFQSIAENFNEKPVGSTRLLLVHALTGGPAVDVRLAEPVTLGGVEQPVGTPLASGMAFGTAFGAFDIPAQTYVVSVFPAGENTALLEDVRLALASGTAYTVLVHGTVAEPRALLLTNATAANAQSGLVRIVHAVIGGPAVDVYDGDTLIVPGLEAEQATEHIALEAGTRTLILRAAGAPADEDTVLVQAEVEVVAGEASTVVAMEAASAVVLGVYEDNIAGALSAEAAVASVVNTVVESVVSAVNVAETSLAQEVRYAVMSDAASIAPISGPLTFDLSIGGQRGSIASGSALFYGGTYYNIVIVPGTVFQGPRALVFPTVLAASLGSAPDAADSLASAAPQPTPPPLLAAPAQPTPPVFTAAQPPPVPAAQQPPAAGTDIIGRVVLDPGANLQLRQNPSPDAFSLGLAPSGATLIVNGREGRPVALVDGQPAPPEAETWEDPVGLLPDDQSDLDPTRTWVNVTYSTADGGRIVAWVLAQFVDIRLPNGNRARLRDLEPIGGNIPGRALETVVTSPPVRTDVLQAVVFNLDPGVSLNIRRTPSTNGEVLGRVQNGTVLEFLGGAEDDQWAFIRFTTAEGGVIEGWVSTLYIQYRFNERTFRLEEFKQLVSRTTSQPLYEVIPPDTRGSVRGPVPTLAAPTRDPFRDQYVATVQLDPAANLQLRRNPDPTAESLGLIPTGTRVIVTARTDAADWLRAEFDGQIGWISAQFVALSFNGATVAVEDVPVDTTLP